MFKTVEEVNLYPILSHSSLVNIHKTHFTQKGHSWGKAKWNNIGAEPLAVNSGLRKEGVAPHLSGQINMAEAATIIILWAGWKS